MAVQNDSSVLFSLKELMSLEVDRVRQEDLARQRAEEDVLRARAEHDDQLREHEATRMRAAEAQRRAHEERARAEVARLDAIRQAEIERARIEADNAARMEGVERQHEHERKLAALHENSGKKKLAVVLACLAVALVGGVGIGGFALYEFRQNAAAAQAAATKLQQDIVRIDEERKAIEVARAGKNAGEIRALEQRLLDLQAHRKTLADRTTAAGSKPPVRSAGAPPPLAGAKAKNPPNCQETCATGDPICVECR